MRTLKVSLAATVLGTAAWLLGLSRWIWPEHPQLATLLLTISLSIALFYLGPESSNRKPQ
jgi:hypothetical protein